MADQQPEAIKFARALRALRGPFVGDGINPSLNAYDIAQCLDELRAQVERLQAGGQVAASAMVPMSDEQIQAAAKLTWFVPADSDRYPVTSINTDRFKKAVRAAIAEFCRINGLTVGIQASGGAE